MRALNIGGLLIPVPVIQGGMGVGISLSGLAAAVANQGGVGVISAAGLGIVHRNVSLSYPEACIEGLRHELRQAKALTNGVFGVNIMMAMTNFADLVREAIREQVPIIFSGAGLPLDLPGFLTSDSITRLVPIVSSARAARIICEKWKSGFDYLPDAIVVEGPKAGGHLGFRLDHIDDSAHTLEHLVPEVVEEVRKVEEKYGREIPVIAAGGIYTGEDMYDIMLKGAKGVQIGSRFVTTVECDASDKFKQTYVEAVEDDIRIINSPVGMPGRALQNSFIDKVNAGMKHPVKCPYHCIKTCDVETTPYCIMNALYNAYKGNMKSGFAFAGSNAYRSTGVNSVKDVFDDLIAGYNAMIEKFGEPL